MLYEENYDISVTIVVLVVEFFTIEAIEVGSLAIDSEARTIKINIIIIIITYADKCNGRYRPPHSQNLMNSIPYISSWKAQSS